MLTAWCVIFIIFSPRRCKPGACKYIHTYQKGCVVRATLTITYIHRMNEEEEVSSIRVSGGYDIMVVKALTVLVLEVIVLTALVLMVLAMMVLALIFLVLVTFLTIDLNSRRH